MRLFRTKRNTCAVPTCTGERSDNRGSVWCEDHTDAIRASAEFEWGREAAIRLGARRWALKAEVEAELERRHVKVLEDIIVMDPMQRAAPSSRACWDMGAVKLSDRVDELMHLGLIDPPPQCPAMIANRDESRRCSLSVYHKGKHQMELIT